MADLFLDNGLVEYNINGACTVTFNPTDAAFFRKIYDEFVGLDQEDKRYHKELENCKTDLEAFELIEKCDREMRERIDRALDAPVSEAVFGKTNVFALSGGLPLWCNLLLTIMDECDSVFAREQMQTSVKIKKYTDKYHKKYHR